MTASQSSSVTSPTPPPRPIPALRTSPSRRPCAATGRVDERPYRVGVADVGGDGQGPGLLRDEPQRFGAAPGDHHVVPRLAQQSGGRGADARSAAGHEVHALVRHGRRASVVV